jgi:Ca2+-binding EF-hand superfamily protein
LLKDNNSFAEQSGWVGKDDGLLVFDKNNNGKIDDGSELFGNNTILSNGNKAANGFEALKDLDSNNDGKIDNQDTNFNNLKIWQDKNSDGKLDEGELLSLAQAGVKSLNTNYNNSNEVDANNNAPLPNPAIHHLYPTPWLGVDYEHYQSLQD